MKKILVIEDELAYAKLLHDQLSNGGCEVITAPNGEEGLKQAYAIKPDLILLDIIMPKLDGIEVLKALRADAWGKEVPIFILTNVSEPKVIVEGMNNSATNYIVKSDIKFMDLLWSIKNTLKWGDTSEKNTNR